MTGGPVVLVLTERAVGLARRIQAALPGAEVHGNARRVTSSIDVAFDEFGAHMRDIYAANRPIIGICAAGILIRTIAPLLSDKRAEPPLLAVAEDGSTVVPLLGGLNGVNSLARQIATALDVVPAITTTGEQRFGVALEDPPAGYTLTNPDAAKRFMSDLLGGAAVRIEGDAPWLDRLPYSDDARHLITVTPQRVAPVADQLIYCPRSVVIGVEATTTEADIRQALAAVDIDERAVGTILAAPQPADIDSGQAIATSLGVPLRLGQKPGARLARLGSPAFRCRLWLAEGPIDPDTVGRPRGKVTIVGLGPGRADWLLPEARAALAGATDVIGYIPYVERARQLVGRPGQHFHATDNRVEIDRASHALTLAAEGAQVAVVSGGDPGIYAMAAAVFEALETGGRAEWWTVEIRVIPGISAMQAAAALTGAPLGHDFCAISLSDNLKPWDVVADRLAAAAKADLVIALYNPRSQHRPGQLAQALEVLRRHQGADTPVILGRELTRQDESITLTTLGTLDPEAVDMRTVVLIGSTQTRVVDGRWIYTPRTYEKGTYDAAGERRGVGDAEVLRFRKATTTR